MLHVEILALLHCTMLTAITPRSCYVVFMLHKGNCVAHTRPQGPATGPSHQTGRASFVRNFKSHRYLLRNVLLHRTRPALVFLVSMEWFLLTSVVITLLWHSYSMVKPHGLPQCGSYSLFPLTFSFFLKTAAFRNVTCRQLV